LTRRERQVLDYLAHGESNAGIARHLGVKPKTIEMHVSNIYSKLDVCSRTQAIVRAQQLGLVGEGVITSTMRDPHC
jgi:LuxR family maltose regulon positive regulatory protein